MSAFYHATFVTNVDSIQQLGLRLAFSRSHTGYGIEPRIWLSKVEVEDPQWYNAAAVFRVDLPKGIQPTEVMPGGRETKTGRPLPRDYTYAPELWNGVIEREPERTFKVKGCDVIKVIHRPLIEDPAIIEPIGGIVHLVDKDIPPEYLTLVYYPAQYLKNVEKVGGWYGTYWETSMSLNVILSEQYSGDGKPTNKLYTVSALTTVEKEPINDAPQIKEDPTPSDAGPSGGSSP